MANVSTAYFGSRLSAVLTSGPETWKLLSLCQIDQLNTMQICQVESCDINLTHWVWLTQIYIFVTCVIPHFMDAALAVLLAQPY
jgi:hypothetical protein